MSNNLLQLNKCFFALVIFDKYCNRLLIYLSVISFLIDIISLQLYKNYPHLLLSHAISSLKMLLSL